MNPSRHSNAHLVRSVLRDPRRALRLLRMALRARDETLVRQLRWWRGGLPRRALVDLLPGSREADVQLVRAMDRNLVTSVTLTEVATLVVIARAVGAMKILEIGTWDGNTAVNLARNTGAEVVTVDLPPDFDRDRDTVAHAIDNRVNVTERDQLGRQIRESDVVSRITQVFGDSATLDWSNLGGPFDLVFIDGCHDRPYVESDTRNALSVLAPDGVLVWHDYGSMEDVSSVVDEMTAAMSGRVTAALQGTRLAVSLPASVAVG